MAYGTITAYVGPNGSGKTLAAIVDAVKPAILRDRTVISNARVSPEVWGAPPDLYVPLESWRQIVNAERSLILLDEITSVLPSRSFASVPPELQRVLNQLRKRDVEVVWTAPNWARSDLLLREVTQLVTVCRGYGRQRYKRGPDGWVRNEDGKRVRTNSRWPNRKLFRWSTYDAMEYDDYQDRRQNVIKTKWERWYYRSHGKRDPWAYETLEPVGLLDHLDDLGSCLQCGRQRKRSYCSCVPERGAPAAVGRGPDA
jgi:hypothetical protein